MNSYRQLVSRIRQNYDLTIDINTANEGDHAGLYYFLDRKIVLYPEVAKRLGKDITIILLHEFGHHLYFSQRSIEENYAISDSYTAIIENDPRMSSSTDRIVILNDERRAWELGRKYAKIAFPNDTRLLAEIDSQRKRCLKRYEDFFKREN